MKKFLFSLFVVLTFIISFDSVHASTTVYDREKAYNYGVNKKYEITNKNLNNVLKTPLVDAKEKIYDYSDILTDTEEALLFQKIKDFYNKTGMEIVIVTENLPYVNDKENQDYAVDFYDYNDFGIDSENYDGVIFFRNTYSLDPYYAMYNTGKAQFYYSESRYDYILDSMYTDIHSGNYYEALSYFISQCEYYYDLGIPSSFDNAYLDSTGHIRYGYQFPFVHLFCLACLITFIPMGILISRNKMVKKATLASEYMESGSVLYTAADDRFIRSHTSSYTTSSSSGGGHSGGGGHSFSGSSGGGHSGGGRHG